MIALLAMLSRSMIADGYMLTTDTDDGSLFQIVLCDGVAAPTTKPSIEHDVGMHAHGHHQDHSAHGEHGAHDKDSDGSDHSDHEDMGPTCAFAMSAHALPDMDDRSVGQSIVRIATVSLRPYRHSQPGRGLPAPPPPARAPPLFL